MTGHSMDKLQEPDSHGAYLPTEEQIAVAAAKIKAENLARLKCKPAAEDEELEEEAPRRRRLRG